MKNNLFSFGLLGALAAGAGCLSSGADPTTTGNVELGIASYQVTQTAGQIVIVGVDEDQHEVATIEIDNGPFVGSNLGDHKGEQLDGRRLQIDAKGEQVFYWEDAGYTQTWMPLGPEGLASKLVSDPFVASYLQTQKIAFQPRNAHAPVGPAGEEALTTWTPGVLSYLGDSGWSLNCCDNTYSYNGTPVSGVACGPDNGTCIVQGYSKAPKSCGGANGNLIASYSSGYGDIGYTGSPYNGYQIEILQACPYYTTPGNLSNYLTGQACNITNSSGTNYCGSTPGGCNGCGFYFSFSGQGYGKVAPYNTNWPGWYMSYCLNGNC